MGNSRSAARSGQGKLVISTPVTGRDTVEPLSCRDGPRGAFLDDSVRWQTVVSRTETKIRVLSFPPLVAVVELTVKHKDNHDEAKCNQSRSNDAQYDFHTRVGLFLGYSARLFGDFAERTQTQFANGLYPKFVFVTRNQVADHQSVLYFNRNNLLDIS